MLTFTSNKSGLLKSMIHATNEKILLIPHWNKKKNKLKTFYLYDSHPQPARVGGANTQLQAYNFNSVKGYLIVLK